MTYYCFTLVHVQDFFLTSLQCQKTRLLSWKSENIHTQWLDWSCLCADKAASSLVFVAWLIKPQPWPPLHLPKRSWILMTISRGRALLYHTGSIWWPLLPFPLWCLNRRQISICRVLIYQGTCWLSPVKQATSDICLCPIICTCGGES